MDTKRVIDSFDKYNCFLVESNNELAGKIFNRINCTGDLLVLTIFFAGRYYMRFSDIKYQNDTYLVCDLFGNVTIIHGQNEEPIQRLYNHVSDVEIRELSDIFIDELIDTDRSADDFIVLNLHRFGILSDLQQVHLERIVNEMPDGLSAKTKEERTIFLKKEGERISCGLYGLRSDTKFRGVLLDKCSKAYDNAYKMFYH